MAKSFLYDWEVYKAMGSWEEPVVPLQCSPNNYNGSTSPSPLHYQSQWTTVTRTQTTTQPFLLQTTSWSIWIGTRYQILKQIIFHHLTPMLKIPLTDEQTNNQSVEYRSDHDPAYAVQSMAQIYVGHNSAWWTVLLTSGWNLLTQSGNLRPQWP